jgi:hypothetical protein
VKGREKSRDEAGDKGMRMEGTGGRSPFTNSVRRYAIDCTAYTGPQMQHGLRVPSNAPITACPMEAPDHKYI